MAKKDQLLQQDEQLRIELMKEIQNRLDIPQEWAEAIIRETIIFYYSIETYIANLKKIAAGKEVKECNCLKIDQDQLRLAPAREFHQLVRIIFGFDYPAV